MRCRRIFRAAVLTAVCCGLTASAEATTINFDELPVPPGAGFAFPSAQYAALGVTMQSLSLSPTVDAAGEMFATSLFCDCFGVINGDSAVSPTNFGVPVNVFVDLGAATLFRFSTPVSVLSLQTDDAPGEVVDIVRLMALRSLGGGMFEVLAVTMGSDAATTAPGNILSLSIPNGFSYAVFAQATEAEGFDNLTFVQTPEPATLVLLGSGLAAAFARRRFRSKSCV
jgi:PEP-CTERM motif